MNFQHVLGFVLVSFIGAGVFGVFYALLRWWKLLPFLVSIAVIGAMGPVFWVMVMGVAALLFVPVSVFAFMGAVCLDELLKQENVINTAKYSVNLPLFFGIEMLSLIFSFFNPWFEPLRNSPSDLFLIGYAFVALAAPPLTALFDVLASQNYRATS